MEKLYTCKCGCTLFNQFTPAQFEERSVNYRSTFGLVPCAGVVVVLTCMNCQTMVVPPANMGGRSPLDVNVQAYGELLRWVETYNTKLESNKCKCKKPEFKSLQQSSLNTQELISSIKEDSLQMASRPNPVKVKEKTHGIKDDKPVTKVKSAEPRNKTKTKKTSKVPRKPQLEVRTTSTDSSGDV